MGLDNSKIKYSGSGPNYEKYHKGLVNVSRQHELTPGIVLEFDESAMIVIALTDGSTEIPESVYTHIFIVSHDDGSTNKIYLRNVSNEQAAEYMSIRKPPNPPPLPNFKYQSKKTTAEIISDNADQNAISVDDITSAIEEAS